MRRSISVALLVMSLALPQVAAAAQPTTVQGQMDVQLWPGAEPGKTIAIVSLILPPDTKLPVIVRLPVPPGTTVDWAGEISGVDPSQDVPKEHTLERGEGGAVAQFELTKSLQGQIELGGIPQETSGNGISSTLRWVQSVPATAVAFSVRLPTGAKPIKIDPQPVGEPASNAAGESLYTLPSQELEPGDELNVSVSFTYANAPAAPAKSSLPSTGTIVGILAAVLAVALVVLLFAVRRQRSADATSSYEPDEPDDEL